VATAVKSVEVLSQKIGLIIIVLGIMHFVNLIALFKLRSKAKKEPKPAVPFNVTESNFTS